MEEVVPRWRAGEAQMQDNPEGGEFDDPVDTKINSPSVPRPAASS